MKHFMFWLSVPTICIFAIGVYLVFIVYNNAGFLVAVLAMLYMITITMFGKEPKPDHIPQQESK
jgi:hypothetical protein